MATLGGDLIRMLAHGGISTLGNVGAQFLGDYLKERAQEKLLGLKTNLETASVESDPNVQQQILQKLKGPLNLAAIQESGMVPRGETPTVENLGQRKGLTYPEAGYTPATLERVVAPVPSLEAIKSKILTSLPQEARTIAAFPKDASLQASRENLLATLALREQEGALNRASREDMSKDRLTMQQMITGMHQAGQEQARMQTQQWRDFLKQNYTEKLGLLKDVNERRQMEGELGKLTSLEAKIVSAKKPEEKKLFMAQANELIKNSPALKGYPMWEEDVTIPGTGVFGSNWFGTKEKVPVGQKSKRTPKTASTPAPLTFPRRVLVKGVETIVNTQDEYDALKRGLGK